MSKTTVGLTNVNIMSKAQFNALATKNNDELYTTPIESATLQQPDYSSGVGLSLSTTYTAITDGWLYIKGSRTSSSDGNINVTINGIIFSINANAYSKDSLFFPLGKGDVYSMTQSGLVYTLIFYPCIVMQQK